LTQPKFNQSFVTFFTPFLLVLWKTKVSLFWRRLVFGGVFLGFPQKGETYQPPATDAA